MFVPRPADVFIAAVVAVGETSALFLPGHSAQERAIAHIPLAWAIVTVLGQAVP